MKYSITVEPWSSDPGRWKWSVREADTGEVLATSTYRGPEKTTKQEAQAEAEAWCRRDADRRAQIDTYEYDPTVVCGCSVKCTRTPGTHTHTHDHYHSVGVWSKTW